MSEPREIEPRLDWFLSHNPSGSGMCAQHTWHSLGGDYGNPPAWGCSDANAVIVKVRASGRYETPGSWDGPPPRGAAVYWEYGGNGHAAVSLGDGRIETTDPSNGQPVGIEPLDYPRRWGFTGANDYTLWTDQYNGVRFDVGDVEQDHDMATYFCKIAQNASQLVSSGGDDINMQVENDDAHNWHTGEWPTISPHTAVQGNAAGTVHVSGPAEVRLRAYNSEGEPMGTAAAHTTHGAGYVNVSGYVVLSESHKLRLWLKPLGPDPITASAAVLSLAARDR